MSGSEVVPREDRRPFFLCYVETTRACNLACPYCMSRTDCPAGPELTTDELRRLVLDELALIRPGAAVAFSGGETLMRPDCIELVRHAGSVGLSVFLNTNGILLTDDALPRLRDAAQGRLVAVLPFNSVEEAEQRWTRGDSGRTVLDAADRCERAGVHHFFLVTVSAKTASSLQRTMRYLRRRQTPVLRAPFVPRGAGAGFPELMLTRELMAGPVHEALASNPLCYISYTPFFASPEGLDDLWRRNGVRVASLGCHAGRSFAAVSAEGGVAPCVQLLDSGAEVGNVRESRLSDLIASHPVFEALRSRDALRGKCGRCRYRMTCGGCRALAFYSSGDILAEDPTCFFEPETPRTRSPHEERVTKATRDFVDFIKYNEPWNGLF
jgi:radical SAM protein with 4Fe4S-binding SPASM domain